MHVAVDGGRHEHAIVLGAALATLLVVVLPSVAGGLGPGGGNATLDRLVLTPTAERVLDELPGATEVDGIVVVPAATDPHRGWDAMVGPREVEGPVADLGVHGLVDYAAVPLEDHTPVWLSAVTPTDRVYLDVGPLLVACVRLLGDEECNGGLLMEYGGELLVVRSGLSFEELLGQGRLLRALDDDKERWRTGVVVSGVADGVSFQDAEGRTLGTVGLD